MPINYQVTTTTTVVGIWYSCDGSWEFKQVKVILSGFRTRLRRLWRYCSMVGLRLRIHLISIKIYRCLKTYISDLQIIAAVLGGKGGHGPTFDTTSYMWWKGRTNWRARLAKYFIENFKVSQIKSITFCVKFGCAVYKAATIL